MPFGMLVANCKSPIKKTLRYSERNHESRIKFLSKLREIITNRGKNSIVYVDESGFEDHAYRSQAWSPKGQKTYGERHGNNRRRTNLIAGHLGKQLVAPLLFTGSTTASLFNQWLQDCLFKELPEGATIVMDNAAFHKTAETTKLFENSPFDLLYLPPYSPDLNPIEQDFAILKKKRKVMSQGTTLDQLVASYGLFLE